MSDELKVGDVLVDNDPRMRARRLTVVEVLPNGVAARDGADKIRLYLRYRIFTDGKARRYGMNRVAQ
jgi:hypothetical protein